MNEVRIIGGKWRSRKIRFSGNPHLRPTPNRVRETIFNWLDPIIINTVCLDMFAGSGALGFEALSRGAKSVIMMDKSKQVIRDLKKNAELLPTDSVILFHKEFFSKLRNFFKPQFDIVFLDPPFRKDLVKACSQWLEQHDCLAPNAFIYTETESSLKMISVPSNWILYRQKTAGQVCYTLWQRDQGVDPDNPKPPTHQK
jgi:16S rRNA (guanine966-N2)-methyltransferase